MANSLKFQTTVSTKKFSKFNCIVIDRRVHTCSGFAASGKLAAGAGNIICSNALFTAFRDNKITFIDRIIVYSLIKVDFMIKLHIYTNL